MHDVLCKYIYHSPLMDILYHNLITKLLVGKVWWWNNVQYMYNSEPMNTPKIFSTKELQV